MSSSERPLHHRCAAVDELLEVRAAELVIQRGLHDAEELANSNLATAEPVSRHDHAGEPRDQRAVEIEERADFRPVRARLDLGHRAGQPACRGGRGTGCWTGS